MSSRRLEEGSGVSDDGQLVKRLPAQRRAASSIRQAASSRTPSDTPPSHAATANGITSLTTQLSLASSSSSRFACLSSPYCALVVTLLLFLVVLSASSYAFLRLQRQHPEHLFTLTPNTASPLLSEHPAFQQLQRELTGQYQQMLTLARRYMDEEQWRDFQAEAVRIDSSATLRELQQQQPVAAHGADCEVCPVCDNSAAAPVPGNSNSRLSELTERHLMTDWSVNSTAALSPSDLYISPSYDWTALEHSWSYCPTTPLANIPHLPPYKLCDTLDFRREQGYQKQQFQVPVDPSTPIEKPRAPQCVWPPPADFVFPRKHLPLPAVANGSEPWVRWSNHFVQNAYNLSMFNYGYGKNLYHFDAPQYDNEQMNKLDRIAAYVPLGTKVRNALDVGAGGGSLSLLLHRRYNVVTLNLVYAELPYCEYITERGGLCAHITAFYSMPFAKFSFDLIHIAWLFHMFNGANLIEKLMEVHRVLRPGGYLWWEGGFSYAQRDDVKGWASALGYAVVWEESVDRFDKTMFGSEPHQCDFTAVFRKPSRGVVSCGDASGQSERAGGGGAAGAPADGEPGRRLF